MICTNVDLLLFPSTGDLGDELLKIRCCYYHYQQFKSKSKVFLVVCICHSENLYQMQLWSLENKAEEKRFFIYPNTIKLMSWLIFVEYWEDFQIFVVWLIYPYIKYSTQLIIKLITICVLDTSFYFVACRHCGHKPTKGPGHVIGCCFALAAWEPVWLALRSAGPANTQAGPHLEKYEKLSESFLW